MSGPGMSSPGPGGDAGAVTAAALPMYDLAELRADTEALWAALRRALAGPAGGADMAPPALDRPAYCAETWTKGAPTAAISSSRCSPRQPWPPSPLSHREAPR